MRCILQRVKSGSVKIDNKVNGKCDKGYVILVGFTHGDDELIVDKNKWNKDDVVVIGDSSGDIMGGKNYGAYTIAYLRNPMKTERLKALNADKYIEDLSEIMPILKENHYFTYNGR